MTPAEYRAFKRWLVRRPLGPAFLFRLERRLNDLYTQEYAQPLVNPWYRLLAGAAPPPEPTYRERLEREEARRLRDRAEQLADFRAERARSEATYRECLDHEEARRLRNLAFAVASLSPGFRARLRAWLGEP